jgi:hypothetical protein
MMHPAQLYAMKLANSLTKITMEEFFKQVHSNFYPDQDISFMEYFLDLAQHEGEFVVPHSKLIDYGVMTSTKSNDTKKKLERLMLVEEEDFTLRHVSQRGTSGAQMHNQYMLTPEAFKKCLMRAQRRTDQPVDPVIYCNYYLRLEQAFKLYTDYERQYAKCLLALKDEKIDMQSKKIDQMSIELKQQSIEMKQMLAKADHIINQNSNLSTQVTDLHTEVSHLNDKIDAMFDFILSFARMTIPTWIGSSIIKQQFDVLAERKDQNYAMKHLKIMFMVGFYIQTKSSMQTKTVDEKTITFKGRGEMRIYACCTNFADVSARIKQLYKRYSDNDNIKFMFKPMAITLISCDVNTERIILENANQIFPEHSVATWDGTYKRFDLIVGTKFYGNAHAIFNTICKNAMALRFHDHQQRIDKFDQTTAVPVNPKIINYIDEVDHQFFSSTNPFCQQYINCYTYKSIDADTNKLIEYAYGAPSRKCKQRPDLDNVNLTTTGYSLRKIEHLLESHTSIDHIQHMTNNGILSKEDMPALRAIAKYENIDTSALEEEYSDELAQLDI